jgi:large-conductance mechanosensitive channel
MTWLKGLLRFAWEFVVGDDWRIAVGVVLALAVTALVSGTSLSAWWILPLAVVGVLGASVWRAAAGRR